MWFPFSKKQPKPNKLYISELLRLVSCSVQFLLCLKMNRIFIRMCLINHGVLISRGNLLYWVSGYVIGLNTISMTKVFTNHSNKTMIRSSPFRSMITILTVIVHSILCNITPSHGDVLDEALASALFRPTSLKCPGAGTSTSFSATFSSTMSISKWHNAQALYEPNVFEVDMIHSDQNENRSWTLRVGKGGHVSSFLVKAGEAIANEANVKSMWNDLVPQMVAVNGDLNTALHPNFIHQAGPYVQDTG
jgi:hypothetical protein